MAISDRGFASMDRTRQKAIASLGGKAAHRHGHAHEWDSEEARAAGRKGGLKATANKAARKKQLAEQSS